jgi:hypothetical protein
VGFGFIIDRKRLQNLNSENPMQTLNTMIYLKWILLLLNEKK